MSAEPAPAAAGRGATARIAHPEPPQAAAAQAPALEAVLLTTTQVSTFRGTTLLTRASGFFFGREEQLYLVTSRHVLADEASGHHPDRVEIVLHTDARDLSRHAVQSLLLFREGRANWRQGKDAASDIDVAVLPLDRPALPAGARLRCFAPRHLMQTFEGVPLGTPLLLLGYPLGFHDTVHHLPVARHAIVASAFGVRFQRQGTFLTDARAHRGSSGAPVLMKCPDDPSDLPWKLLGVHSTRMDMGGRDLVQDESLGLNAAWYADVLMTLTADAAQPSL